MRPPPPLTMQLTWRSLYETGAFAQRELVSVDTLRAAAKERRFDVGFGREALEEFDREGALQPIGFAAEAYWTGWTVPAAPPAKVMFREESDARPWDDFASESDGVPTGSALYSPWQLLYVDDVLDGTGVAIGVDTLVLPQPERDRELDTLREFVRRQEARWRGLDEAWRPLMKTLVRLQNYYWPRVSDLTAVVHGDEPGAWVEAGEEARYGFEINAAAVLDQLGSSVDQIVAAYHFLVARGVDREPEDGLLMLRRARPRAYHSRWRGLPRRAQDHFDAAELLRRFVVDLTGEPPPGPSSWPMDGRQSERTRLYERGPAAPFDPGELKAELDAVELYPHGVRVVGEGQSEAVVVGRIVSAVLGWEGVRGTSFSDLGGSGAAARVEDLIQALSGYALRTLVIVDREGQMAEYLEGAFERGTIAQEDVLMFDESLEASNSSPQELIDLAREVARNPPDGRDAVELELDVQTLIDCHEDRRERASRGDKPGLAETLIHLAANRHEPPVRLDKEELVEALAERIVGDLEETEGNQDEMQRLFERRPIVQFVFERLIPVLNRARPAGRRV